MQLHELQELARFSNLRAKAARAAGVKLTGAEPNIAKLSMTRITRLASELGLALQGPAGQLWKDEHADPVMAELALFVEAGLSPLTALRTATTDAARYAGDDPSRIGFRIGAPADLVLLTADPRDDIRNTRAIAWVVQRGTAYDRGQLDAKLAALRSTDR